MVDDAVREVFEQIVEINVNPGDHVTTGQPLVRVDPTQLESSAEAQAASAQAARSASAGRTLLRKRRVDVILVRRRSCLSSLRNET